MRGTAPQLSLFPSDDPFAEANSPGESVLPHISVRESARARRLSIKVYPRGKVEVVVPRRCRAADVEAFVKESQAWIKRARDSFGMQHPAEPFVLPQTIDLPAIGQLVTVHYVANEASSVRYRFSGGHLTLSGQIRDEKACIAAIRRWLGGFAKKAFAPRLQALSKLTGIGYKRMQVRAQRSCWGSRSSSGTLSLNLCLMFLRPELMRYLMVHELCHGRHMNHSKRFWRLVARYEPQYRALDRELSDCWRSVPSWLGIY